MRWVRTNRRCGGWLALAAVALQVVLSFGHVHLEMLQSKDRRPAGRGVQSAGFAAVFAQHPANEADDYCAICAIIHIASTSFLPDAPLLPVPFVSRTVEHFSHFAFVFVAPQRTAFQSRAPPLA